jgi:DNA mismatch repair protein MutS
MIFHGMLSEKTEDGIETETSNAPIFFGDLYLDQIIDAITAGKEEYNLKPFFYTSLSEISAIKYRHEIMQDLENAILFEQTKCFAKEMRLMREHLIQAGKLHYKYQKEAWFLGAAEIYCDAIKCFVDELFLVDMKARGFLAFREYLADYAVSPRFTSLMTETKKLKSDLSRIKYCLLIKGDTVKVRRYESEIDYSADVEQTFERFKQGAVKDYRVNFTVWAQMNHIEEKVLELVTKLYPEVFSSLDDYCARNLNCVDEAVATFDREIQFYVAYLEYIETFVGAGLKFCYPEISTGYKDVSSRAGFDLALARKLIGEKSSVVCNDFYLKDRERILVVSGPNQGGKTTFARAFGQLHYLASLGCPVPGREARLLAFHRLFTHFEREENIKNLRGKLQDDLVRIHDILGQATSNSIIIMNEIFTSTTLQDAVFLSKKIMNRIIDLDLLCVWVTFIDELASFGEQTVSMVSTVVPDNPVMRTYKVIRKRADGLSYAIAIAEKYRVTYDSLRERIKS